MKVARYRSAARCAGLGGAFALGLQALTPANAQEPPAQQSGPARPLVESMFEVRAGVTQSDNYRRVSTGEDDGTLATAGFGVDTSGRTPRTEYRAQGDLDWIKYPDNAFDTQAQGYFDGDVTFSFVPDTFKWFAQETFGQLVTDPFSTRTPDTIENVNNFSTGPEVHFDLGSTTVLDLYGNYSNVGYEISPLDNESLGGGVELGHRLSTSSLVSVNASHSSIDFDQATVPDYDITQYFARYQAQGGRTQVTADAGYSQYHQDGDSSGGTLARLNLSRRISAANSVELIASRQYSANGQAFRDRLGRQTPGDASMTLSNGNAFLDTTFGGSWTFQASRTALVVYASRAKEEYKNDASADRTISSFDVSVQRRMRPSLTLRLAVRYSKEDFDTVDFDDTRRSAEAALDWRLGRHLGTTFRYEWYKDTATLPTAEYTENRIGVQLFYRFGET